MNDGYSNTINSILGLLGIVVILGGAVPVFIGTYRKSRLEELSTWNKELTERVVLLEKNEQIQLAKIESLEKENGYLKDLISLRAPVEQVITKLSEVQEAITDAVHQGNARWERFEERNNGR